MSLASGDAERDPVVAPALAGEDAGGAIIDVRVPVLLGFNEPDMSSQSNMTVSDALRLWPRLMATGMRLGSPAVAANAATR